MRYMIFGGTGSLGKRLIDRFLSEPKRLGSAESVAVVSRDEAKHWSIRNELHDHPRIADLRFYVGDVRDKQRVENVIRQEQPTHIIIAAALKQVDTCELSPDESIATNVVGTQNIVDAVNRATPNSVTTVVFVSTDKACAPVNVYGMCKSLSERIVTSQAMSGRKSVKFVAVRYGNVLESRGSIIPLFKYQAEHNESLTVTDPDMTRYVMTLDESVNLIRDAIDVGKSGETWIPRLPSMRVGDLAQIFSERYNKPIKIIGLRPGEKTHEDLINSSESVRTYSHANRFVIEPAFNAGSYKTFTYTSGDEVMTKDELKSHLTKLGILDAPLEAFKGVNTEEIMTNRK